MKKQMTILQPNKRIDPAAYAAAYLFVCAANEVLRFDVGDPDLTDTIHFQTKGGRLLISLEEVVNAALSGQLEIGGRQDAQSLEDVLNEYGAAMEDSETSEPTPSLLNEWIAKFPQLESDLREFTQACYLMDKMSDELEFWEEQATQAERDGANDVYGDYTKLASEAQEDLEELGRELFGAA